MNRSIKIAFILTLLLGISYVTARSVIAQSEDRSHPTPLRTPQVSGRGGGGVHRYYYSFVASPGDLIANMRVYCNSANGFGPSAIVEDLSGNQLLTIDPNASYNGNEETVSRQRSVVQETPVILNVYVQGGNPDCTFRINLSGDAVAQLIPSSSPSTEIVPSASKPPAAKPPAAIANLTGRWQGNDGGTYYIRQVGDQVWWSGESARSGAAWNNVFHGRLSGNSLVGDWADVPKGSSNQSGTLNLQLATSNRLTIVNQTGGFGGTTWTRR
jgi:hypothetical protein